uniref:Zinc binding alcohol dehydrogenase domain containing 2 n=1 Tax=Nephromyces sp. MMRI TaxID=2496275 RepID=A0A3Q8UBV7_9APIC|nr:zinc binding alcohol dehydrogenase domain containing 2 [Nephromyces sp. MMRI]
MKAVQVSTLNGLKKLYLSEVPRCNIMEQSSVLIKTISIGVNRMDIMQREGRYPVPQGASQILGVEASGYVQESTSEKFKIGDKVMTLVSGGAYSEYIVAPDCHCMKIPEGISFNEAASIPENWLTSYQLLNFIAKIKSGDSVLIHAAASGIGCAAIQLCKFANAREIIATSRSQSKLDMCKSLGATHCITISDSNNFSKMILDATQGRGVDILLDPIGSSYFKENISCCALDARWVLYGMMGGSNTTINLAQLFSKRISFHTTTLRSRSFSYRTSLIRHFSENCLNQFQDGSFKAVVDQVFSWQFAQDAHSYMEKNSNIGKIILKTGSFSEN